MKMKTSRQGLLCGIYLFAFGLLLLTFGSLQAAVKMPAIFGDHMVLQRDGSVPVWGWADPGETVKVTAGGATASATAAKDGKWMVRLEKLKASPTPIEMTIAGKSNTITIHDVLVGDVWVCSGQSNMAMSVGMAANANEELANANLPTLRLFLMSVFTKEGVSFTPQQDCRGQWEVCTPAAAKKFSAAGYYFGKEIVGSQKIPVGLIGAYRGATLGYAWTNLDALKSDPELEKEYVTRFTAVRDNLAAITATHDKWMEGCGKAYKEEMRKYYADSYFTSHNPTAKRPVAPTPAQPEPQDPETTDMPTVLYNGIIAPLMPFAIKGVLWYQGESQRPPAGLYRKLLPALITGWRKQWGEGDFPFIVVQLPNYLALQQQPSESGGWAVTRDAQCHALSLPNTGMVVTIDLGDIANQHPLNKKDVGLRLALIARHLVYGEKALVYSGPMYDSMKIEGNKVRLAFQQTGGGLSAGVSTKATSGAPVPAANELKGFAIAGADKKWVWAKAQINGNTVVAWSDEVPRPVAVRYAWASNPVCNLYNKEGLPASPFRTDDWDL